MIRSVVGRSMGVGCLFLAALSGQGDPERRVVSAEWRSGFVDLGWDDDAGRLHWRVDTAGEPLLLQVSVASGLGSNPIGIDRGALGPRHVVRLRRIGARVLLIAENLGFRATGDDERERRSVDESFADSVLWGFDVVERDGDTVVVDATDFVVHDWFGAARRVRRQSGKSYALDARRSAIEPLHCRAFPDNSECEALLTFAGDDVASEVATTAADGRAFTIRQRISLVRLPDDGYAPRAFDPRVGYFGVRFVDHSAPLGAPMQRHWIARHRLQKRDPSQPVDEVVAPIVYHLDPGVPEPVRSALKEGAGWWAEAFEAAGFRNAFRVEDLPPDADALDVRYHVIHWVHRATRGWSYGQSVTDPRTGEILKGSVLLGSLRVRQDHLLFRGLGAAEDGCCAAASPGADHLLAADDPRRVDLALARIRQLAAHEVGHTLGLSHSFAASGYGRASVMDYPAPWVRLVDGEIDFSQAYGVGIGGYDRFAIRWGYGQPALGETEAAFLAGVIEDGLAAGYAFLTDQDARSVSSAHPDASLWDNGSDPVAELENAMLVADRALASLDVERLGTGRPRDHVELVLVPTMLHWRYQLEAAAKLLGGVRYRHAVVGDGQPAATPVAPDDQNRALGAILRLLDAGRLTVPARFDGIVAAPGDPDAGERFPRTAGLTLDATDVALAAAAPVLGALLDRERLGRIAAQPDGPSLADVLAALRAAVFGAAPSEDRRVAAVQRALRVAVLDELVALATDGAVRADVRDALWQELVEIRGDEVARSGFDPAWNAHRGANLRRILDAVERRIPELPRAAPRRDAPPGAPIGSDR